MTHKVFQDPLVLKALGSARREFKRFQRTAVLDGQLVSAELSRHMLEVAQLIAEAGFGPDVVAASLLHDHLEELPAWSESRLEREFGAAAAGLVFWTTHENKRLPLSSRNELFLAKLRLAPEPALAIVCADRASNMLSFNERAIVALAQGSDIKFGWSELPGPWPEALRSYERLYRLFSTKVPAPLLERYASALERLEQLARECRLGEQQTEPPPADTDGEYRIEATRGRIVPVGWNRMR